MLKKLILIFGLAVVALASYNLKPEKISDTVYRFEGALEEPNKKNGGNINHILRYGAEKISEKIQVKEEIQILISARAYELKLMTIIPAFIILYLSVTSPGYFQVLYFNPIGILIMSICLLIYIFAYYIGKKILNIPV